MGQALIRLGTWMSNTWCKALCLWNALLVKMTVKVNDCPNKLCKCNPKK